MTTNPARLALGLAGLAGERAAGDTGTDVLATAVGVFEETGRMVRGTAGRVTGPPARAAVRAVRSASRLPGAGLVEAQLRRVRERGSATVAAGRAELVAAVQSGVDDAVAWLLPRVLDRAMPQLRTQVLPVLIDEMTSDRRVRDLLAQQGRSLVDRAAEKLLGPAGGAAGMGSAPQRMLAGRRSGAGSG